MSDLAEVDGCFHERRQVEVDWGGVFQVYIGNVGFVGMAVFQVFVGLNEGLKEVGIQTD